MGILQLHEVLIFLRDVVGLSNCLQDAFDFCVFVIKVLDVGRHVSLEVCHSLFSYRDGEQAY